MMDENTVKEGLQKAADIEKQEALDKAKKEQEEKNPNLEDQINKLKEANDAIERELLRKEELRAKAIQAGKAQAGQYAPEKTPQEKAQEEAKTILSMFR